MKKMMRKIIAFLLVFTIAFTSCDISLFAAGVETTTDGTEVVTVPSEETDIDGLPSDEADGEEVPSEETDVEEETSTDQEEEELPAETPAEEPDMEETPSEEALEILPPEEETELPEEVTEEQEILPQLQTSEEDTILCEEVEKRTESSKTFRLTDGSFSVAAYDVPVHYKDEDGNWQDIDTSLTEEGEEYSTTEKDGKSARVKFSKKLKEGKTVSITHTEYPIAWGLKDAEKRTITLVPKETGEKKGNDRFLLLDGLSQKVKYKDIYEGVDAEYIVHSGGVKENIILKEAGTANAFQTVYDIGKLTPVMKDETTISLLDGEKEVYRITAPYMSDAEGERSHDLSLSFEETGNKEITVTVTADKAWLEDEARVYPVTIDPYVLTETKKSDIDTTFITKDKPSTNHSEKLELLVGRESSSYGYCRTLVKFVLPELSAGDMVVNAKMRLFTYDNDFYSTGTPDLQVDAHRITSSWELDSVTWNTKPGNSSTVFDYAYIKKSEDEDVVAKMFDITKAVKGWYEGDYENYGIMLKSHSESGSWAENGVKGYFWPERYNTVSDAYPVIQISYRNNKGLEDYWTYTSVSAGRAGTAHINDYTGNLVFVHDAVSTTGLRLPVSIQHIYNGYMKKVNYIDSYPTDGRGWKTSIQQTVKSSSVYGLSGTALTDFPYAYEDGDGTVHFFYKKTEDGKTKYIDEDGLGMELTISSSTKIITDKEDNQMMFDSYGNLTKIKDASGNTITISYTNNELGKRMITTVKDGAGHVITFTPNTSGSYLLRTVQGPGGKYVKYYYTTVESAAETGCAPGPGYLILVRYSDGTESEFAYDEDGALEKVTSTDGSGLLFTYTSDETGKRVKKVVEFGTDGTSGQTIGFDRKTLNKTTIAVSGKDDIYNTGDDIRTMYQFDNYGRTINARYGTRDGENWDGEVYTYTDGSGSVDNIRQLNRLSSSGYSGKNVRNYLKDHGAEIGTGWSKSGWEVPGVSYTAKRATDKSLFGESSWKLSVTTPPEKGGASYLQSLTTNEMVPGKNYTLSGYIKTSEVEKAQENGGGFGAAMALIVYRESGNQRLYSDFITGTTQDNINDGWKRVFLTVTVPEDTTAVKACMVLRNATGTAWFDGLQLEEGNGMSSYNLLENAGFEEVDSNGLPTIWTIVGNESGDGTASVSGTFDERSMKFNGNALDLKRVSQLVNVGGKESDIYVMSGWAKASALQDANDKVRAFSMYVRVYYSDGTNVLKNTTAEFNRDVTGWQKASVVFDLNDGNDSTDKNPTKVNVGMRYYYQENEVYFDNAQLVKDVANSYTYDKDGNLTAVSAGKGEDSAFVYNSNHDLTSVKDAEDKTYKYTYDDAHRVTKATAPAGQNIEFTYGTGGNVISTVLVNSAQDRRIKTTAGYNAATDGILAGTYETTQTNEMGDTVSYEYDLQNGQLLKVTDTDGIETVYTYKNGTDLLTKTECGDSCVSYTYNDTNTLLTSIDHSGTKYAFTYDKYGNIEMVSAGGNTLVTNTYASGNGKLLKSTYGNGDVKEYNYDREGNVSSVEMNGTQEHVWEYDTSQLLSRYTDKESGRKTSYGYDITGRLAGLRIYDTDSIVADSHSYEAEYAYDKNGSVTEENVEAGDHSHISSYTYNKNGQPLVLEAEGVAFANSYDTLGRLYRKTVSLDTELCYDYEYNLSGWNEDGGRDYRTTQVAKELIGDLAYRYTYDSRGNILTIKEGTRAAGTTATIENQVLKVSYVYDNLGQLVREDNVWKDKTIIYVYDNGGNLTSRIEYDYTTASDLTTLTPTDTILYSYESDWKDRLASYDGIEITYDTIGNPLTYRGYTMDWEGRNLKSAESTDTAITYKYDADGIRTEKTVGDTTSSYYYSGGRLSYEKRGAKELFYIHDAYGNLSMLRYYDGTGQSSLYHVVTNIRGDVEMLYNENGTLAVRYYYDAWGNLISMKDGAGNEVTSAEHIGQINPIRYRGYYYDAETGFYYVSSRYYDPEIGRFINPDSTDVLEIQSNLYDKNLYAYCDNNPVMRKDETGDVWIAAVAVGVVTQYAGDVLGNLIAGKSGMDLFTPTSSIGEYIAAGVTALMPGSGIAGDLVRNVATEAIVSVERHIKGQSNSLTKSVAKVAFGTVVDTGMGKVTGKVDKYIESKMPRNYSSYAGKQYKKNPGITQQQIRKNMGRSVRWGTRISNCFNFIADTVRSVLPW